MPGWESGCFGSFKRNGEGFYSKQYRLDLSNEKDKPYISMSDDKKGKSFVELEKKDGLTLGLIISGGIDKNSKPIVANLRPSSIAYRSDALAVGDHIISVNGIRTSKLKHEEIINLLKNAGTKVTLEIEYEIPSPLDCKDPTTSKIIQVKLEKENDSFGFILRGGVCPERGKSSPLIITHVRFGGPADRVGIIKTGDRLLAVDGISLSSAKLEDALKIMKQINQTALLTIEYDVSCIDAVKNATGPLLIEIDITPGCFLGINLSRLSIPEHAIVIESIRQASVAERCGALHVGDHVLAIDHIKIDLMTSAEAMQLLRSCSGKTVKLEVLPFSQISMKTPVESQVKRGIMSTSNSPVRSSFTNSYYNTLSSLRGAVYRPPNLYSTVTSPVIQKIINEDALQDSILHCSSDASLNSATNSGSISIAHADRIEVVLHADHKGFGFSLQGHSYPSNLMTTPPFISCIDHGSPAERSGVLQVGDRILAINGETTEGMSLDEIMKLIENSHPCVILITEFDVAEAVVPSSGTFLVKLAKSSAGLGISVTAPRNRQFGEPLIIADIKKGSVSHRTGSIQPGDKLLAINSLRTENCTIEDATAILHTCTDIVKLSIRKDEAFSEDPDATCAIIYTVELIRHGGPLGITVSGTKEPFDPIFISGLTEKGLAERTGALHVGDRILAINGNSLRGKTLNEAICILQTCGDVVTLKISKCPCPEKNEEERKAKCAHYVQESHLKKFATPLPSIDSAVDSWDSCNPVEAIDASLNKSDLSDHSNSESNVASACCNSIQQSTIERDRDIVHWEQKVQRSNSYSGCPSEKDSWHNVLEDLQTCGQSRWLRQIEQSILGLNENIVDPKSSSEENVENSSKSQSDTLSENNLLKLNSRIEQLDAGHRNLYDFSRNVEQPNCKDFSYRHSMCVDPSNFYCPFSFSAPLPIEIHKVTLFKDQIYEDFGFSLSDSEYENGVYINSIRPGGPADLSGLIKPLDKILQVNNVKTYNAGLIVPLIAASGDRIELVTSRPAYNTISSSGSTLDRISNYDASTEDERERKSSSSFPKTKTYTKTL